MEIIIVSYNAGDKLLRTLKSVLDQEGIEEGSRTDVRVIVKDGASTDESVAAAKRFLDTCPQTKRDRVRILQGRDGGIYDAMNIALDACMGRPGHAASAKEEGVYRLVYFINCGDTLAGTKVLQTVSERVRADLLQAGSGVRPPAIYYGDVMEDLTKERVASNPRIDDFALYRHVPCHQACFYDAALFEKERFDTSLKVRADYDHFLKSCYRYRARCVYLPVLVAHYEGGGFSETGENRKRSKSEHRIVLQRYMDAETIRRYDRRMKLTLQPLRTYLAENKKTAAFYNAVRRTAYRIRGRES